MVLKIDVGTIISYSPVPAFILYVVLIKKNKNPISSDVNEHSSKDIDMLTDWSWALMRDWIYPLKQPIYGDDEASPRRRSETSSKDNMSNDLISERKSIFTSGWKNHQQNSFHE